MLCAQKVRETLGALTGFSEAELDPYAALIESAIAATEAALNDSASDKAVLLAAAKANYMIALAAHGDGVTSFKAGDVSFTMSDEALKNAETLVQNALADCGDVLKDSGFAFRAV